MRQHLQQSDAFERKNLLQKGFTLVELLVVIVILGILAAVVVFAVGGSTDKAQASSCAAEKSALGSAVEAYRASVGSYPTTITQLTTGSNRFLRSTPSWYTVTGTTGQLAYTTVGSTKCVGTPPN